MGVVKKRRKNGFIFTTDAFLALPLIILAISSFLAFSITLKDNLTIQEYTYRIAKDSLNVLIDSSPSQILEGGSDLSFAFLITNYIYTNRLDLANQTAAVLDSIVPNNVAYILEYKNSTSEWKEIRRADPQNKIESVRYSVQISSIRLVSQLSTPSLNEFTSCPAQLVCSANPSSQYKEGKLVGPILLRIRVFI